MKNQEAISKNLIHPIKSSNLISSQTMNQLMKRESKSVVRTTFQEDISEMDP
jgi:hypothetical protein